MAKNTLYQQLAAERTAFPQVESKKQKHGSYNSSKGLNRVSMRVSRFTFNFTNQSELPVSDIPARDDVSELAIEKVTS